MKFFGECTHNIISFQNFMGKALLAKTFEQVEVCFGHNPVLGSHVTTVLLGQVGKCGREMVTTKTIREYIPIITDP